MSLGYEFFDTSSIQYAYAVVVGSIGILLGRLRRAALGGGFSNLYSEDCRMYSERACATFERNLVRAIDNAQRMLADLEEDRELLRRDGPGMVIHKRVERKITRTIERSATIPHDLRNEIVRVVKVYYQGFAE